MTAGELRRLVCVESPFRGDTEEIVQRNVVYADACMLDALQRGEAPFLGHLLYPRVLDDQRDSDRAWGIECHCAWLRASHSVAAYTDLGLTTGMRHAVDLAVTLHIPIEFRTLGDDWLQRYAERARPTPLFH